MTQARVFVTYVPASRRPLGAASRRAPEPVLAVLAGALAACGGVHAAVQMERPDVAAAGAAHATASQPVVASYAFALVLPAPSELAPAARPSTLASPAPVAKKKPPVTPPRRDLPGFLEDRGLTLTVQAEPTKASVALAAFEIPIEASQPSPISERIEPPTEPDRLETAAADEAESQSFPTVMLGDRALGAVTMRAGRVHLASLVGLLQLKLPSADFERLSTAPAADSYVDLDTLRAAGIDVALAPGGERITLAAR